MNGLQSHIICPVASLVRVEGHARDRDRDGDGRRHGRHDRVALVGEEIEAPEDVPEEPADPKDRADSSLPSEQSRPETPRVSALLAAASSVYDLSPLLKRRRTTDLPQLLAAANVMNDPFMQQVSATLRRPSVLLQDF